jgi:hypothetical protein
MNELIEWLTKKMEWSYKTFGSAERHLGVLKHIEKEIDEVRQNPQDVSEWIDIILLAFDGACRMGFTPEQVVKALISKQEQNTQRHWPPPGKDDEPSFHLEDKGCGVTAEEAWQLVVDTLELEMMHYARGSWLQCVRDSRLISYEMGCFQIEAKNNFVRDWLAARLTSAVRRMLTGIMNRAVEVEFVTKGR